MAALVTLAVAKAHLQIPPTTTDADADLERKAEQASATLLGMMTPTLVNPTWTADTVPLEVQALVLVLLGYLVGNRGDLDVQAIRVATDTRSAIAQELMRLGYRDPALA
jgi:hypothetical protein